MKYCKNCGYEIDSNTNKCTGCGKQYTSVASVMLFVVYAALIISSVYFYNKCQIYKKLYNETIDSINQEFINRFGEYQNPITGEYVTGYESYLDALDAQMEIEELDY